MKQILFATVICSLILLGACKDAANEDDKTGSDTTTTSTNDVTKATLSLGPDQEVPVNNSKASGTAEVSYNKDNQMLTYTVNWNGLTGNPTMAHIHGTAPRGANAGVVHDLSNSLAKSTSGSFTDSVMVDGNKIKEDSLLAGFYYFNIHTAANPGGEIRGQIELKK